MSPEAEVGPEAEVAQVQGGGPGAGRWPRCRREGGATYHPEGYWDAYRGTTWDTTVHPWVHLSSTSRHGDPRTAP